MADGTTYDERPARSTSSTGPGPWIATAIVAVAALAAALISFGLVAETSREASVSVYSSDAGWVFGIVPGLLLAGAVLLLVRAATGRTPAAAVVTAVLVASLLAMQGLMLVASEHGRRV